MRFPLAALFFIVGSFIFFACFGMSSWLIDEMGSGLQSNVDDLGSSELNNLWSLIPSAFGVIAVLFFIVGVLLIFVLDATADEPEYFYERRR